MWRFLFLLAPTVWAAPCTTATSTCTEWVGVPGQALRLLVYRNFPLETRNENITRALILIHGGTRNANQQFRSALAGAFLNGALDDTMIIAPRFASNKGRQAGNGAECHDIVALNEALWVCETERAESWRYGGPVAGNDRVTSYDFIDEILQKVGRKQAFPNLRAIVVAGHSGGGIFVTRYSTANLVHNQLGVPVTYIAANATNYAYPDALRPTRNAYPLNGAAPGYTLPVPPGTPAFLPFADSPNCTGYDNWPYGLRNRIGYSARLTDSQWKKQLAARPVTYLLGDMDLLPLTTGDDLSCAAYAQGPTRLARGLAFVKYLNEGFEAHNKTAIVPLCGHNDRCMFTSETALPLLFPKP
ncbi:MAG: alpha/beta fold hydrolase [Bryobacteraceae bacterium]